MWECLESSPRQGTVESSPATSRQRGRDFAPMLSRKCGVQNEWASFLTPQACAQRSEAHIKKHGVFTRESTSNE